MDTKKFLQNPHEFARLYPITTRYGSSVKPGLSMKAKTFDIADETETGYQITGDSRILWFRLESAQSKLQAGSSALTLAEGPDEGFVPTYWLPWSENQIYRMTLRPSSKVNDGVDPDYFFTAPVSGCSIFVEGPPEQPTVYHANAQTHGGDYDGLAAKAYKRLQKEKADYMRQRYLALSATHEKRGKGVTTAGPGNPREVSALHYLNRGFQPDFPDDLQEVVDTLVGNKHRKNVVIDENLGKIKVKTAEGTVFGVRKDGTWKFYFQKRVLVTYLVNEQKEEVAGQTLTEWGKSFFDQSAWARWLNPKWRKETSWMTLSCAQFWPDGGGQAVVRL